MLENLKPFDALGFFSVDKTTFMTIISNAIAYLVIMIQFGQTFFACMYVSLFLFFTCHYSNLNKNSTFKQICLFKEKKSYIIYLARLTND